MFNNIDELRDLIRQGKNNKEIIGERILYLNSEEYKKNRKDKIKKFNSDIIVFYDGFIPSEEPISFTSALFETVYSMDLMDIYDELVNLIRNNMDKKGISIGEIIKIVSDYFKYDENNTQYKDMIEFLKENNFTTQQIQKYLRESLPQLLNYKKHSSFDGSLLDFIIAKSHYFSHRDDELAKEFHDSVDWDYLDNHPDIKVNLSDLKGNGIAMCTEKAMTIQNLFSFLGYDSYMICGALRNKSNNKSEGHNFNVIKTKKGYSIVDAAQCSKTFLGNNFNLEDLGKINIDGVNGLNQEINYSTNFSMNLDREER